MTPWSTRTVLTALAILIGPATAWAQEPLHVEIDRLVTAGSVGVPAPLSSDGEFLRRASIDLIGMPPTFEELEAFLADTAPNLSLIHI